jgi:predicted acetylornithine/succinylornithine family transaminase
MTKTSSLLGLYARPAQIFIKGQGLTLTDSTGKTYLDFTAGIAVNALGHNDPNITKIITDQSQKLIHLSNLYHNEYQEGLANQIQTSLSKSKFTSDPKLFFCNSGTEATEAAFKFARKYQKIKNIGDKFGVVSFLGGFHGRTMGSLSATPNPKYQEYFRPLVPGFKHLPFNNIEKLNEIDGSVGAVILEPIQGEGGIIPATKEFFQAVRDKCDEVGALMIADEIQCGIGRTGKMFGFENYGCAPDIITMAKPIANGLPLGAVVLSNSVAEVMKAGDHGTTFGGSPLTTRVAQYVWKTISDPKFLDHVFEMGEYIRGKGQDLIKLSPLVQDVRGKGLLMGLQLRESVSTAKFVDLCREKGLLVVSAGNNTIRLVPALIVTKSEIDAAFAIFEKVITIMEGMIASGKM